MTWIVIARMVWSAAKAIDNVLSSESAHRTMIETIRMNDGKLNIVREGVCLQFGRHTWKKSESEESKQASKSIDWRRRKSRWQLGKQIQMSYINIIRLSHRLDTFWILFFFALLQENRELWNIGPTKKGIICIIWYNICVVCLCADSQ